MTPATAPAGPPGPSAPPGPEVFADDALAAGTVRRIEDMAATAWPAREAEPLDGWTLRHTPGFASRRVNSVLAHGDGSGRTFEDRLAAAEAYYAARGLPCRFQATPASLPADLAERLDARGYEVEAPVDILIAPVAGSPPLWPDGATVEFPAHPAPAWLELYRAGYGRDIGDHAACLPPSTCFPLVRDAAGAAVGLGIGVAVDGWLCGFGLLTRADRRGQGIGTALLAALRGWGLAQGAFAAYLQVERDNEDARRVYEKAGFRRVYGYHYRTRTSLLD